MRYLTCLLCAYFCFAKNLRNLNIWSVHDGKIHLDMEPIDVRGITLNGFENDILAFNGLWKHSMEFYLDNIKKLGFNFIRVPFSIEMTRNIDTTPHPSLISNDLECANKTSLQIMDLFFEKSLKKNFAVVLNLGRLHKDFKTESWHDDRYPVQDFMDAWFFILDRYQDQKNLVGLDIYDEPGGSSSDPWLSLVDTFIKSVNERYKNNRWIYLVQGVRLGQDFNDFSPLLNHPKIAFTPHVFETQQNNDTLNDLYIRWYHDWGFLKNSSTVIVSRAVSESIKWKLILSSYLIYIDACDTFYWSLSNDPYTGIFLLDWTTIDYYKIDVLNTISNSSTKLSFN